MSEFQWFEDELNMLGSSDEPMQKQVNENILNVIKAFSAGGHSGFSAGYAIPIINRLLQHKPLSPIEDGPDQWHDRSQESGYSLWQHKRCGSVFKDSDGVITYGEARVFSEDGGKSWFAQGGGDSPEHLRSSAVIELPFTVPDAPEYVILEPEENKVEE